MNDSVMASAPGSIMLLGEHAVLKGHCAIVCAVNYRVKVTIRLRTDNMIKIESMLGSRFMPLDHIDASAPFQFLAGVIKRFILQLDSGFLIRVESEISPKLGLASSAAVTVASMAAIEAVLGNTPKNYSLHDSCLSVIREVQGTGSGADVAASVYGGVLNYKMDPRSMFPLCNLPPLTLCYSGSKRLTADVIRLVENRRNAQSERYNILYSQIDSLVDSAVNAIQSSNWPKLGLLINEGQSFMESIGVSNDFLASIVNALRLDTGIYGAKISGAGLGDCVVGIGTVEKQNFPFTCIGVTPTWSGVKIE